MSYEQSSLLIFRIFHIDLDPSSSMVEFMRELFPICINLGAMDAKPFYSMTYSLNSSLLSTVSNPSTLALTIITLLHCFSDLLTGNPMSSVLPSV